VQETLLLLRRIASECQETGASDPQLAAAGARAQAAADDLARCDQGKQAAVATLKHANADLYQSYDRGDLVLQQLRCLLFAVHGKDGAALARYGVRPMRTRKPLWPIVNQDPLTQPKKAIPTQKGGAE
jgi:hypothetical protein